MALLDLSFAEFRRASGVSTAQELIFLMNEITYIVTLYMESILLVLHKIITKFLTPNQ